MLKYLVKRALARFARRYDAEVGHLMVVAEHDPLGVLRLQMAQGLGAHRFGLPAEVYAEALLVALHRADCGACLELGMKMAEDAGVAHDMVRAIVLESVPEDSPSGVGLAISFAQAVLDGDHCLDELAEQVRARWGVRGQAGLSAAIAGAAYFPVFKRGMGYAQACMPVTEHIRRFDTAFPQHA